MKKMSKVLIMTLVMVLSFSTMAFASKQSPAKQLQQKLKAIGVPNSYIGNVVEYLQKVEITQDQANKINAKIDAAVSLLNGEKNLSKLDKATKESIKSLAQEAANVLGLKITFGKNSKGYTTATITDVNGKVIVSLSTADVRGILNNLDSSKITDLVAAIVEFSNNPDKTKFDPISGDLNNTATNNGNVMAAGFGLVGLAGVLFVGSKRLFA